VRDARDRTAGHAQLCIQVYSAERRAVPFVTATTLSLRVMARPSLSIPGVARFLGGLALLVALDALGNWLVHIAHAPIPGSVIGMLLLTLFIELGVVPLDLMRSAAEFLVRHLALLYVPAGVALLVYAGEVRRDLVPITLAAMASLLAVLVVVGLIVQRFERDA
jgi:holin-like protein